MRSCARSFVVMAMICALGVSVAQADWNIPPTKRLVFDPAFGVDMRSPMRGLGTSLNSGQPGVGFGLTLFSLDECRFRLLGVSYAVDGRGTYLTLAPMSLRLSGEPGQGWTVAPVFVRGTRQNTDGTSQRWQGFALQLSLRFSTRVDPDIAPYQEE